MAHKKTNLDFILSDSALNVYGFRLSTPGYKMDEFLKNPIGYYGHDKQDGVLLRWEDVRVENDAILGKPVINLEHPRAGRTISELEDGFLNAASMGGIVVLDYHMENQADQTTNLSGDTATPVLVIDAWYNKECSLVDSPANRDALKVELFDRDDNPLNLRDLMDKSATPLAIVPKAPSQPLEPNRQTITMNLTPELISLLNLNDQADESAILAGIRDLHDNLNQALTDSQTAMKALENERQAAALKEVKALLDKGLADGKFTAATRCLLENQYAANPTALRDLIDTMQAYHPLADRLNTPPDDLKDCSAKTYDELDKAGKLPLLKEKAPDLYREKYKSKFGKLPA